MQQDSGYVLVTYGQWQIETSLWMAIIILMVVFFIGYFLLRVLVRTSLFSQQWTRWRHLSNEHHSLDLAQIAACELAENKWQQAEHYFSKATISSQKPLLYYMAAALAAAQQNADQRRDDYLKKGYHSAKEAEISLGFLQAQLQIQAHQWSCAMITLNKLQQSVPHHPLLQKLLLEVQKHIKGP